MDMGQLTDLMRRVITLNINHEEWIRLDLGIENGGEKVSTQVQLSYWDARNKKSCFVSGYSGVVKALNTLERG